MLNFCQLISLSTLTDISEVSTAVSESEGNKPVFVLSKELEGNGFDGKFNIANSMIECCLFPESLKKAYLSPVFKTGETAAKKNSRPISVLSAISKVF